MAVTLVVVFDSFLHRGTVMHVSRECVLVGEIALIGKQSNF